MNRIASKFTDLANSCRKGFIPFVTAGDPDLATSLSIIEALAREGADVIELGVPFSDPMADGPTIQASSQRALANGVKLSDVLKLASEFRMRHETPIVLFGYLNPFIQYGLERFCKDASTAGIDGVLVTDVVDDEALAVSQMLGEHNIDLISLVAPTTTDERLERIGQRARGFIYAVSRAGVTGASDETSPAAERLVNRVRSFSKLPVAVGFGISTREQIEETWKYADAAVVGSAIVSEIAKSDKRNDAVDRVTSFVRGILPSVAKTSSDI